MVEGVVSIDINAEAWSKYTWGQYTFVFPRAGNKLYEVCPSPFDNHFPLLRTGMLLKDEEGIEWQIVQSEIAVLPKNCLIKGLWAFGPVSGIFWQGKVRVAVYEIERYTKCQGIVT
jgi:hypothetical protein